MTASRARDGWDWTLESVVASPNGIDLESLLLAVREVTLHASDGITSGHPVVRALNPLLDTTKLEQAIQKALSGEVFGAMALVEAARYDAQRRARGEAVLWIRRFPAWRSVADYARTRNVRLRVYDLPFSGPIWDKVIMSVRRSARFGRGIASGTSGAAGNARQLSPTDDPQISYWMAGRRAVADAAQRSDLFWLIDAPLDRANVLLCYTREDAPAPKGTSAALSRDGFRTVRMSEAAAQDADMPVWKATPRLAAYRAPLMSALVRGALKGILTAHPWSVFVAAYCANYIHTYALWRDFFEANDVKVDVTQFDFVRPFVARSAALADAGGVGVSYQYSNLDVSTVDMSMSADVLMSFGPAFKWVYRENRSTIDTIVFSGYPTDNAFEPTRPAGQELRENLIASGARFIVAFFDENSSDSRAALVSHATVIEEYSRLLDWLDDDLTLGLIIKPKAPGSLRERLGHDAAARLDEAVRQGRCLVVGQQEGAKTTGAYPCEAAHAADLVIGGLYGGTAALESHLVGCRTVFLDAQHLANNPAYANGGDGRIVFGSVTAIREAAMRYREQPESIPGFGDLTEWAADRVRLRDGRSAERIGTYVKWLYDSLVAGATRDEALQDAADRYAAAWGNEYVERVRGWR